jgi:hypothetical protein
MRLKFPLFCLLAALLAALAMPVSAEMVVGNVRVIKVTGSSAQLLNPAGKKTPLKEGVFIQQGSKILTGRDSTVSLVFENGSSVLVEPSSQFSIDQFVQDPFNSDNLDYKTVDQAPTRSVTKLSISEGDMIFDVARQKSGSSFQITTPVGVAGIRGTSGSAGSKGFGLATGSGSFTPPGGSPTNIGAGQQFSPGTGLGPLPTNQQQSINAATQSMNSNTPPNTFNAAPPNITPQQHSALQAAAAQGGDAVAQVAAQLAGQSPAAAADIAAAAAYMAPQAAPQIAGSVAQSVPAAAVDVAQSVAKVAPQQAAQIAQAVIAAVPSVDPAAVQQATQQGAGLQQGNQPLTTGDQGTTTAGQQLPGTGSGASGNPGQSNPRPTPIPTPTPPSL